VQECYDLTVKAFNFSERFRQPVLVMADEVIAHMRERIVVPDVSELAIVDRKQPADAPDFVPYQADGDDVPPMAAFGDGHRWHVTGLVSDKWGFPTGDASEIDKKLTRILRKVLRFRDEVIEYEAEGLEDADILVVSYGCVSRSALRAVREARSRGVRAGYFRPVTLWPFPDAELLRAVSDFGVKRVIVPELNAGQMSLEIERAIRGEAETFSRTLLNGELFEPSRIVRFIEEVA
jgi:2-oxoglutarate ferredoxin oxidoreductase subunit alpha